MPIESVITFRGKELPFTRRELGVGHVNEFADTSALAWLAGHIYK